MLLSDCIHQSHDDMLVFYLQLFSNAWIKRTKYVVFPTYTYFLFFSNFIFLRKKIVSGTQIIDLHSCVLGGR